MPAWGQRLKLSQPAPTNTSTSLPASHHVHLRHRLLCIGLLCAALVGCRQDGPRPGSHPLTEPPADYPKGAASNGASGGPGAPGGSSASGAKSSTSQGGAAAAGRGATPDIIWEKLGEWKGKHSTQTESFTGLTGALRIKWEAKGPADGTFVLTIHSSISGRPLQVAVDQKGPGGDVAYVNEDPRVFFAVIETDRMEYSFTIDEAMGTRVVKP